MCTMGDDSQLYAQCVSLLKAGLNNPDSRVRLPAVFLAGETGNSGFIPELHIALQDRKPSLRGRAAEALGKTGTRESLVFLKTALFKDRDVFTRACAAEGIGKIADQAWLDTIRLALEDRKEMVRVAAAEACLRLGDNSAFQYLPPALKSKDPQARRWACEALAKFGDARILGALSALAKAEPHPLVAIWAARAVLLLQKKTTGSSGPQEYFSVLNGFMKDKDRQVRSRVACALGDIAQEPSFSMLETMLLRDQDTLVRIWAAEALGKLGPNALACLAGIASSDRDLLVRAWAAEALGKLGRIQDALETIRVILGQEEPLARLHAAKCGLVLQSARP